MDAMSDSIVAGSVKTAQGSIAMGVEPISPPNKLVKGPGVIIDTSESGAEAQNVGQLLSSSRASVTHNKRLPAIAEDSPATSPENETGICATYLVSLN